MATWKVKLYSLSFEQSPKEYEGSIEYVEDETLSKLRIRLKKAEIMEFSFDFWDDEIKCRIKPRLERLNKVGEKVFLIPITVSNQVGRKRPILDVHVENDLLTTHDIVSTETEIFDLNPLSTHENTENIECSPVPDDS